jgi:hypothetical protein
MDTGMTVDVHWLGVSVVPDVVILNLIANGETEVEPVGLFCDQADGRSYWIRPTTEGGDR